MHERHAECISVCNGLSPMFNLSAKASAAAIADRNAIDDKINGAPRGFLVARAQLSD